MRPRKNPIPTVSEKDWQAQVEQLAEIFGWRKYHTRWSTGSEEGFPDLIMVRKGRLIVAELKKEGESPTYEQEGWLGAFREVLGAEVFVWRPSDLDHVTKVLR